MSNSLGLVDFAVRLEDSVLHLHVLANKQEMFSLEKFGDIQIPEVLEFLEAHGNDFQASISYDQTKLRTYFNCYFY